MTAGLTPFLAPIAANNFGDTRDGGLAGPMGLFIISLLAIGTVLLIRNMNKRLRRLPESFPTPGAGAGVPAQGGDRAHAAAQPDAGTAQPGPDQKDGPDA
jgi:hypothetical protein